MTELLRVHDEGSGFPILWIHGFPLSSELFAPQMAIGGFRHLRPDLRGFGQTPPAGGKTTMQSYARDLCDLLDARTIERAIIAGLSMGGYIAMQLLRDEPHRVAALLLLDTRETADSDDVKTTRYATAGEVEKKGISVVVESMLPKMLTKATLQANDGRSAAARRIMESSSSKGVVAALRAMAERPDSSEVLRRTTVPALIVVGAEDPITPEPDARRMASLIAGSEVAVISNAAHLANLESPGPFNQIVRGFLQRKGFVA
jgi:3-oxoadipate enol-lactonase